MKDKNSQGIRNHCCQAGGPGCREDKVGQEKGFVVRRTWWTKGLVEVLLLGLIFALNFYLIYPFFGTPTPDTSFSGPIIPLLTKAIELFGIPLTYATQIVNIAFFLLLPISYYFFIRRISGRKLVAFLLVLMSLARLKTQG